MDKKYKRTRFKTILEFLAVIVAVLSLGVTWFYNIRADKINHQQLEIAKNKSLPLFNLECDVNEDLSCTYIIHNSGEDISEADLVAHAYYNIFVWDNSTDIMAGNNDYIFCFKIQIDNFWGDPRNTIIGDHSNRSTYNSIDKIFYFKTPQIPLGTICNIKEKVNEYHLTIDVIYVLRITYTDILDNKHIEYYQCGLGNEMIKIDYDRAMLYNSNGSVPLKFNEADYEVFANYIVTTANNFIAEQEAQNK